MKVPVVGLLKNALAGALMLSVLAGAHPQETQTFTGTVTDSMCADTDHSLMRMGPTDAECTIACIVAHGALYVLYDGEQAYTLSDQEMPERFAGQEVIVTGTLDTRTGVIQTASIAARD